MFNIECPFNREFRSKIVCPYINIRRMCADIEVGPGSKDSWCSKKIRDAIDGEQLKEPDKPKQLMRQNYRCHTCGLKSFVIYTKEEDIFDISAKIDKDHKQREPGCPNSVEDINIVGKATKI